MKLLTILILTSFCMGGCLSAKNGIVNQNMPVVNNQDNTLTGLKTNEEPTTEEARFYYPVYINESNDENIKILQKTLLHRYGQAGASARGYYYPLNIVVN